MRNEVVIEGMLNGVVPKAVYRAGAQLRVETEIVHNNTYSNSYFSVMVQSRGWLADKMLTEYAHGRNVVITGRLRPGRHGILKVVSHNVEFTGDRETELNEHLDNMRKKAYAVMVDDSDEDDSDEEAYGDADDSEEDSGDSD